MLEILLTALFVFLIVTVEFIWMKAILFLILLVLVWPGIYAMYKGAPFVPSISKALKAMLKLGNFWKEDRVVDIGCGDGRVIRAISKLGVKEAVGYELSLPTWFLARVLTFLCKGREKIYLADFWKKDLSEFDVIVCFLMKDAMLKFENEIWPKLKKGTRVISNSFKLKGVKIEDEEYGVYLYVKK